MNKRSKYKVLPSKVSVSRHFNAPHTQRYAQPHTKPHTKLHALRRFISFCLATALLAALATIMPAKEAVAAPGDWVSASISGTLAGKYGKYHAVSGLPQDFYDYADNMDNMFYYSTIDFHAIYCIEIARHYYYQNPTEDTTPAPHFTDPNKQKLLTYLLANGQRFFGSDEESVKKYTATQIAVWIVSEDHLGDDAALDLILFPATGNHADDTGFAPTLEVGRMARALLEGATDFVSKGGDVSTLLGGIIPSFASRTEADAQLFTMQRTGTFYQADIVDENGVFERDWPKNLLTVTDKKGLDFLDHGDTLTINGNLTVDPTTIELQGPYSGYELRYLSTTETSNGEPFQRMARLARLDSNIPLYFKLTLQAAPNQTASLDLNKVVKGSGADIAKQFTFTASFRTTASGGTGTEVSGILLDGKPFTSGSTFTLRHGTTARFTNIPVGTAYELIESDYTAAGYTSDKPGNKMTGTIGAADLLAITFNNTYKQPGGPGPGAGTTIPKTGDGTTTALIVLVLTLLSVLAPASLFAWSQYRIKR